jgi:TonB family protein
MLIGHLLLLAMFSVAAQASPPRPINPGSWVQASDYPFEAAEFGLAGKVRFRLAVDPQGRVTGCQILQSAGPELDAVSCRVLVQRARFEPAHDSSGQALASTYESQINWTVPEDAPVPFAPAARFAESWTSMAGGRPRCHVRVFGRLPLSVTHADCPPGSIQSTKSPLGLYITLRTATLLLPIGQQPPFRTKVPGRPYVRDRYQLAVDWRGVVVRCEPLGKKKPAKATLRTDECAMLMKQGQPPFEAAPSGTPLREAVMEFVSTSE